jgi:psp operon transcriptional activator
VLAELEVYPWPGNVRELRNVVERAVYRHENPERPIDEVQFDPFRSPWAAELQARVTPTTISETAEPRTAATAPVHQPQPAALTDDFRSAVAAYERALLEDGLARNRYNQRATAAALGLSYDQLRHALKRHKLLDAESAA